MLFTAFFGIIITDEVIIGLIESIDSNMDVILILFKKNGSQKTFSLPSDATVIGRRQDCDLCIPLKSVSRKHCQLNLNTNTLKIRDLNSHNGTYLNNKRIDEATVKAGDYLKIGPLTFLIQIDGQPEKIVPPQQPAQKPAQKPSGGEHGRTARKEKPEPKIEADEDSFAKLELDESDTDLADLEDL